MASHLGLPPRSPAELEAICERCGFAVMKQEAADRDALAAASGASVKQGHFRKGNVGGWREVMRPEDVQSFNARDDAMASACGLRMCDE